VNKAQDSNLFDIKQQVKIGRIAAGETSVLQAKRKEASTITKPF
jgi:hypothetical protein|tara:strand:+ start:749 stop:880 length:132 start_codon:yes stop_codon:yes gene_type:complete